MKKIAVLTALFFLMAIPVAMSQAPVQADNPQESDSNWMGMSGMGPGSCQMGMNRMGMNRMGMGMGMGMGMSGGMDDGMFGFHCNLANCPDLNLTSDQLAKIKQINFDFQNNMIDYRGDMNKARLQLRYEMQAESPNQASVTDLVRRISGIRGRIMEARVNHFFQLRQVLTPDQLKTWNACHQKRMGQGMGMHGGRGFGNNCPRGMGGMKREGGLRKGK